MMPHFLIVLAFVVTLGFNGWLCGELKEERAAHEATKAVLQAETQKGLGWKTAYEQALKGAQTLHEAAQACLDRQVTAEQAREEREAIMRADDDDKMQNRPVERNLPSQIPFHRASQEKGVTVTDETRKRAAARLNRDF